VSRDVRDKAELVALLIQEMRETSTVTILFHQAIADRLGMNVTDHKCAGILSRSGPITAGELARRTGLTTGAITGVIDRLEQAGFARRARDSSDRRRVIIEPDPKRIERKIVPLFDSMGRSSARLFDSYTAEELTLILDFTVRARAIAEEETRKLREPATKPNGLT
jgi:DNA-binding MarR family transcriptional regulator